SSILNEEKDNFLIKKQNQSTLLDPKSNFIPFKAKENLNQFFYGNKDKIGVNSVYNQNLQNNEKKKLFENFKAKNPNFTNSETNKHVINTAIDFNEQSKNDASLNDSFEYMENLTINSEHPIKKPETQIYFDDLVPLDLSINSDYYYINRNTYQESIGNSTICSQQNSIATDGDCKISDFKKQKINDKKRKTNSKNMKITVQNRILKKIYQIYIRVINNNMQNLSIKQLLREMLFYYIKKYNKLNNISNNKTKTIKCIRNFNRQKILHLDVTKLKNKNITRKYLINLEIKRFLKKLFVNKKMEKPLEFMSKKKFYLIFFNDNINNIKKDYIDSNKKKYFMKINSFSFNFIYEELEFADHILIYYMLSHNTEKKFDKDPKYKVNPNFIGGIYLKNLQNALVSYLNINSQGIKFSSDNTNTDPKTNFKSFTNESVKFIQKKIFKDQNNLVDIVKFFSLKDFIEKNEIIFPYTKTFMKIDREVKYQFKHNEFALSKIIKIIYKHIFIIKNQDELIDTNILRNLFSQIIVQNRQNVFIIIPHLYFFDDFFNTHCNQIVKLNKIDYVFHIYFMYLFELWLKFDWKNLKDKSNKCYNNYKMGVENLVNRPDYKLDIVQEFKDLYKFYESFYLVIKKNIFQIFFFLIKPHLSPEIYFSILNLSNLESFVCAKISKCLIKLTCLAKVHHLIPKIFKSLPYLTLIIHKKDIFNENFGYCGKNFIQTEKYITFFKGNYLPFYFSIQILKLLKNLNHYFKKAKTIERVHLLTTLEVFFLKYLEINQNADISIQNKIIEWLKEYDYIFKDISNLRYDHGKVNFLSSRIGLNYIEKSQDLLFELVILYY
ncbi:hypothetical protein GVAV_003441, partial [Gurleya vavrai]